MCEWIKCSDRMPERNESVLIYAESCVYVAFLNRHGRWDDGDYLDNITGVTHWLPLPRTPGE